MNSKLSVLGATMLVLSINSNAYALCDDSHSFMDLACQRLAKTWNEGDSDIYLPFHTYHLRSAYTDEKIDSFREDNWGLGYGRSRYENGNLDMVYGMYFLDSHSKPEPMVGYAHEWMWGDTQALHAGLGYTVFVTARSDLSNYMPIPAILPIASVNYGKVSVNTTYVPGGNGYGNIFFFWSRFSF